SPLVCVLDTGEGQARLPAASGGQGGFGRALTDSDDLFDVLERLDAELRHGHPDAQVGWMKAGVDVDEDRLHDVAAAQQHLQHGVAAFEFHGGDHALPPVALLVWGAVDGVPRRGHVGGHDTVGAEDGRGSDGQVVDDAAVGQRPAQELDRLDRAREAARGPDGLDKVTVGDQHVFAALDIGGGDRERQFEVGEGGRQVKGQEGLEPVALDQPGLQRDVDDVSPGGVEGDLVDLVGTPAAGVHGAEDGAHRGARDDVELSPGALQGAEHTDMGEAPRTPAR